MGLQNYTELYNTILFGCFFGTFRDMNIIKRKPLRQKINNNVPGAASDRQIYSPLSLSYIMRGFQRRQTPAHAAFNTTKLFSRREGFPAGQQNISARP